MTAFQQVPESALDDVSKLRTDLAQVQQDLARMRRRNRTLAGAGAITAGIVLLAAGFAFSQGWQIRRIAEYIDTGGGIVSARGFRLLNSNGEVRAAMQMNDGEPSLDLFDAAGKPCVTMTTQGNTTVLTMGNDMKQALTISVDNGDPQITLRDKNDAKRLSFWVHGAEPQIRFYGKDAKPGLAMYMADQSPVLMLCNEKGPQMMMAVAGDSSRLSFGNPLRDHGQPERILMTVSNDEPMLQFSDSQGHHRFGLKATKGETVLGMSDGDGKYRFSLNAAANDIRLSMLDEAGKTRLAMRQDANEDAALAIVNDTGKVMWTAP